MYAYCYLVLREHSQWFGGDSEEVTPVPMPNTEVKLFSADGSRGFPPVRVGRRQAITRKCNIWRISSAGRASALQAEGRRFEPVILHHICRPSSIGRATDL